MAQSSELNLLAEALAKAQAEYKIAAKDSANPFFRSKYADLASVWEACREALTKNGIAVVQAPEADGAKVMVTTTLIHSSGQWISSVLTMTAQSKEKGEAPKPDDSPQAIGSAITYARRYSLMGMVGIAPEDDDGEAAQGRGGASQARPAATPGGSDPGRAARSLREGIVVKRLRAKYDTQEKFQNHVASVLGRVKSISECSEEELAKLEATM